MSPMSVIKVTAYPDDDSLYLQGLICVYNGCFPLKMQAKDANFINVSASSCAGVDLS